MSRPCDAAQMGAATYIIDVTSPDYDGNGRYDETIEENFLSNKVSDITSEDWNTAYELVNEKCAGCEDFDKNWEMWGKQCPKLKSKLQIETNPKLTPTEKELIGL